MVDLETLTVVLSAHAEYRAALLGLLPPLAAHVATLHRLVTAVQRGSLLDAYETYADTYTTLLRLADEICDRTQHHRDLLTAVALRCA